MTFAPSLSSDRRASSSTASPGPELALSAERKRGQGHARVIELVAERAGRSGVLYAGSRDGVDKLAEQLVAEGVPALAYHAGLDKDLRTPAARAVPRGRCGGDGGDHRFRHGRRQAGRPLRHPRRSRPPPSKPTGRRSVAPAATARPPKASRSTPPPTSPGPCAASTAATSTPAVKAVQMRKVRQLYAMLDGIGCRPAAVRRYFGETGRHALRPVRPVPQSAARGRCHRGRAEGALGGASPGRPVRARPHRRPSDRQDQGPVWTPRRGCPPGASAAT